MIILITETGMAQACPFQSYLDLEKQGPNTINPATMVSERVKWQESLKDEFTQDTKIFYNLYINHSLMEDTLSCVSTSARLQDQLDNNFPTLFLIESAKKLSESQSPIIKDYAFKIISMVHSGAVMPTKIFLHLGDHTPSDKPAGYDRSNKGIFFDLLKIDPAAYNIYLVHEFAHAFDPKLANAINVFNNDLLVGAVAAMVRDKKTFQMITAEEKNELNKYILAGLNRGVLAELRAWVITSKLYLELLRQNEQSPVVFLDPILGTNRHLNDQQLIAIWWCYLLKNFSKPSDGLFASPLLQDALNEILSGIDPNQYI